MSLILGAAKYTNRVMFAEAGIKVARARRMPGNFKRERGFIETETAYRALVTGKKKEKIREGNV